MSCVLLDCIVFRRGGKVVSKGLHFFEYLFLFDESFVCMYICVPHTCLMSEDRKKVLDLLERELQVMSHHMRSRVQT